MDLVGLHSMMSILWQISRKFRIINWIILDIRFLVANVGVILDIYLMMDLEIRQGGDIVLILPV